MARHETVLNYDPFLTIGGLVGGFNTSENMKVNGKDDIPYMKWKIKHVPNHQPVVHISIFRHLIVGFPVLVKSQSLMDTNWCRSQASQTPSGNLT